MKLAPPIAFCLPLAVAIALDGTVRSQVVPCSPTTASGVICLTGNLSDTNGAGPLVTGQVYHIVGSAQIQAGDALTVQTGAIVKFADFNLNVFGTLNAGDGAVFSSIEDDTAGGDTNGNGAATTPARGDWVGITFRPGASGTLDGAELRYLGRVELLQASPTLKNLTIREHAGDGALDLNSNSFPTVTGCDFRDGDHVAVVGVPALAVPSFTGCTATGNDDGDYLQVEQGTLPGGLGALSFGIGNTLNQSGVLVAGTMIDIGASTALTLESGMVIKFSDCCNAAGVDVTGALLADGVVFTSLRDDSHAGDTNKDGGATRPQPGDWQRMIFRPQASASVLKNGLCRFAGRDLSPSAITVENASITLQDFVVEQCATDGMLLQSARPTVTDCQFDNNGGIAVRGVAGVAVERFTGNTAVGNALGDFLEIGDGAISSPATWDVTNSLNDDGLFVLADAPFVFGRGSGAGSLTLGAGVVLKFRDDERMLVSQEGTLVCQGSAAKPVVFTSIHDDSVLGDSEKNGGATTPTPGIWRGLRFQDESDQSVLDHAIIRFAGGLVAAVQLVEADISMRNTVIELSDRPCLDLSGNSFPVVADCVSQKSLKAMANVPLEALGAFFNNSGSGNQLGDYVEVTAGRVSRPTTLKKSQTMNGGNKSSAAGVLVLGTDLTVDPGVTLTVEGDMVLKWLPGAGMVVNGTALLGSAIGAPVVLTSFDDDSAGGDTNNNGNATQPSPGDWRGITLGSAADSSVFEQVVVRFGGGGNVPAIRLNGADATLRNSTIERCASTGLHLGGVGNASFPTVADCTITRCGRAVDQVHLAAMPGFTNCSASLNTADYQRVVAGTLSGDLRLAPLHTLNGGPLVVAANVSVPVGATLTVDPGTLIKLEGNRRIDVFGTLTALGAAAGSIAFTSLDDDQVGGDTNKNGSATIARPGDWGGIALGFNADSSVLSGLLVRYGGANGAAAIDLNGADAVITDCTIEFAADEGLDLSGNSVAEVRRCRIADCGGRAADGVPLRALPTWIDNTAARTGLNAPRVTDTTTGGAVRIDRHNTLGADGVLVVDQSLNVGASDHLILGPGLIVKLDGPNRRLDATGPLELRGTGLAPIVITRIEDDEFGGDTNQDGNATVPAAGAWRGISWLSTSAGLSEHVLVRFAGNGAAALVCRSAAVGLHALRAEHAAGTGIELLAHAGAAENLVAFRCQNRGIDLASSAIDLVHATVTECGGAGIANSAGSPSRVINSIAFRNVAGNFTGFAPTALIACNGDPAAVGLNGNINLDPQFVDALGGDLHLQPGSPCVDAANPSAAPALAVDHDEASRVLDHDLDATAAPDMGAHELAAFRMTVSGEARVGRPLAFTTTGTRSGVAYYLLGFLDGAFLFPPAGWVTIAAPSTLFGLGLAPTGVPFVLSLPPNPALAGFDLGVQAYAAPDTGTPTAANVTNRFRATLFR